MYLSRSLSISFKLSSRICSDNPSTLTSLWFFLLFFFLINSVKSLSSEWFFFCKRNSYWLYKISWLLFWFLFHWYFLLHLLFLSNVRTHSYAFPYTHRYSSIPHMLIFVFLLSLSLEYMLIASVTTTLPWNYYPLDYVNYQTFSIY